MDYTTQDVSKYEYAVRTSDELIEMVPDHLKEGRTSSQMLEAMLINFARQGFELVQVVSDGQQVLHYFRRTRNDLERFQEKLKQQQLQVLDKMSKLKNLTEMTENFDGYPEFNEDSCSDCPGEGEEGCCLVEETFK